MRRRSLLYKSAGGGGVDPSEAASADVCLYDKGNDGLIIVPASSWSAAAYPLTDYTPVGVVVIPGSHNVYNDGSCAVMSIKAMHCDTPAAGSTTEQTMYWGVYGTDLSLQNLNVANYSTSTDGGTSITGTTAYPYLPSDAFTSGNTCVHDTNAKYYDTSRTNYAPSPFLTDGSRNPMYYQTSSPSSTSNALADFDGVGNTSVIITARGTKDYTTQADYPAASCCNMFHTDGTNQGDWYLPACGELGYICARRSAIDTTIAALNSGYGTVGVQLATYAYWSSSEYSSSYARTVNLSYGYVNHFNKSYGSRVRAFLRVGA